MKYVFSILLLTSIVLRAEEPAATPRAVAALEELEARTVADAAADARWDTGTYVYDPAGNIAAIGSQYFLYDNLGRLKKAKLHRDRAGSETRTETYAYDVYGNLTQLARTDAPARNFPVNASTNHLTGVENVYDDAGNLKEWKVGTVTNKMTYDAVGMPAKLEAGTAQPRLYIYTANDERLWTYDLAGNTSHWTIRDLDGKVLRDLLDDGTAWSVHRDYYYRADRMLASTTATSELHYSLDHLGTPRLLTNQDRHQIAFQTFLPFGEEISESPINDGAVKKFTSHERDSNLAGQSEPLDYMHARFYSGRIGRFLAIDPVLDTERIMTTPAAWNRYAYVSNRPTIATDPDGRVVKIVFDLKTGVLIATDLDTGKVVRITGVFSGQGPSKNNAKHAGVKDKGPVPPGRYLVGLRYNRYPDMASGNWNWYKLYGSDGRGGYRYDQPGTKVTLPDGRVVYRDGMNLHTGLISHGCVTVPSELEDDHPDYPSSRQYDRLQQLLDRTKPLIYKGSKFVGELEVVDGSGQ